jgi:hypothetical protein
VVARVEEDPFVDDPDDVAALHRTSSHGAYETGKTTGSRSDTTFIFVTATNPWLQPTTITHLQGVHFPSVLAMLFRRCSRHFEVVSNPAGSPMPHLLGPGAQWTGAINRDDLLLSLALLDGCTAA